MLCHVWRAKVSVTYIPKVMFYSTGEGCVCINEMEIRITTFKVLSISSHHLGWGALYQQSNHNKFDDTFSSDKTDSSIHVN